MIFKKNIIYFILITLSFSLLSCGSDDNSNKEISTQNNEETQTPSNKETQNNENQDELNSRLIHAALNRNVEGVLRLLEIGADINSKNPFTGDTVLMISITYGPIITVKALITRGANVNLKNNDGFTALTLATSSKYTEIAQMLRLAGATE